MASLTLIWLQFAVCAVLIGLAGFQLSRYGDVIAHRTGLSGGWIGMALLATATSLPELVTGITSVTVADAPNLALGNALGSCNLNLFFLVVVDFLSRREPLWHRASQGHVLAAGFGVVMLGFVMVSLLVSHLSYPGDSPTPAFLANLGFSLATPVVFLLYMVAMRTVFSYERAHATPAPLVPDDTLPGPCARRCSASCWRRRWCSWPACGCRSSRWTWPRRWAGTAASSAACSWPWSRRCPNWR